MSDQDADQKFKENKESKHKGEKHAPKRNQGDYLGVGRKKVRHG